MTARAENGQSALGFLTVVAHQQQGLFGGYLLLSPNGRPLEFHCTAGVRASRAQEILFGPTLDDYLYGEVIGQTLVRKSSTEPLVICTDIDAVLAVRPFVRAPVTLIEHDDQPDAETNPEDKPHSTHVRVDPPHGRMTGLTNFRLGRNRLTVSAEYGEDQRLITERLSAVADSLDMWEPFCRIREAIKEAQKGTR